MIEKTLIVDSSTPWYKSQGQSVHLSADGTWGAGTLSLEKMRGGSPVPVYDQGTAITFTANFDEVVELGIDEMYRLTLTGSTSPNLIVATSI